MKHLLAPTLAAFAAISTAATASAQGLNLTVDGIRNTDGSILVLVFDKASAFEQLEWRRAVRFADIPARTGRVAHRFADLTSGPYAVFVLHDENRDQDLNHNGERLLEGIGATGATMTKPYPDFTQASVGPGDVTVHLYYDQ